MLPATRLGVAVSGGADSFALLALLLQLPRPRDLIVLSVDHQLRADSAKEIAQLRAWCKAKNITHHRLLWHGDKPSTGIQSAARVMRYRLLAKACTDHNINHLVTAHHADDQAETILAALARGAGPDGLAGMPLKRKIANGGDRAISLWRPLLGVPSSVLKQYARRQELPFSHDPSNDDPKYERVRRRAFLAAAGALEMLPPSALSDSAAKISPLLRLRECKLTTLFNQANGLFHSSGAIQFDRYQLSRLGRDAQLTLLARAIETVGSNSPGTVQPSAPSLSSCLDTLPQSFTFRGALVTTNAAKLWIMREPAALTGRKDGHISMTDPLYETKSTILFDKRFIIHKHQAFGDYSSLVPLGLLQKGPQILQNLAATQPVLKRDGAWLAVSPFINNMLFAQMLPWNRPPPALHVTILSEERFYRRVIRF